MKINIGGISIEGSIVTRLSDSAWGGRRSKAVTVEMSHADAAGYFTDNAPWSVTNSEPDENGLQREIITDMSEYAIAGPITDNRDGTVTVRMGKYSDDELMAIPLSEAPANHAQAVAWRVIIEQAVQSIADDAVALTAAALHPDWAGLTGTEARAGMRFRHSPCIWSPFSSKMLSSSS